MLSGWAGWLAAVGIGGLVVAALLIQGRQGANSQAGRGSLAQATVNVGSAGRAVPRSFLGFSVEFPVVPTLTGAAGGTARATATLLGNVSRLSGDPPVIRVGGNSTDGTWWNPNGKRRPAGVFYDITPQWLNRLGSLQRRTKSRLILGLNLGVDKPEIAVALARAALEHLPRGSLTRFELGNEPDAFTVRPFLKDSHGTIRYTRARGYSYDDYLRDIASYFGALRRSKVRNLAGPGFCCENGDGAPFAAFLRDYAADVNLTTLHRYALSACGVKPSQKGFPTAADLLSNRASAGYAAFVRKRVALAARYRLALRVTEANSAACGGAEGVSNTFAAALWAPDLMFELVRAGAAGIDFHGVGVPAWYTPFYFDNLHGRLSPTVLPIYYGTLLFAAAAPPGARLLSVATQTRKKVKVWATRDRAGIVRVAIINKDLHASGTVSVRIDGRSRAASLVRLQAPSLAGVWDVRWGGQEVPRGGFDGRLRGRPAREGVVPRDGVFLVRIEHGGAAVLTSR